MDAWLTKERKPTFLGGVNGMICGLVGITPCAGWVNGWGAIAVGAICLRHRVGRLELSLEGAGHSPRWTTRYGLSHARHRRLRRWHVARHFRRPEHDRVRLRPPHCERVRPSWATSGVTYLVDQGKTCTPFGVQGLLYTGSAHQLWEQFRAGDLRHPLVGRGDHLPHHVAHQAGVLRGARYKEEVLEVGDLAIHGEEAFPEEEFRHPDLTGPFAMAGLDKGGSEIQDPAPPPPPPSPRGGGSRPRTLRTKGDQQ